MNIRDRQRGALRLVGSRDGRDGSVTIHQDVNLYAACLGDGEEVTHEPAAGRKVWVQIARGKAEVNGTALEAGDGVALADERRVTLLAVSDVEVLLFDMTS